jgi:hypothetical protein
MPGDKDVQRPGQWLFREMVLGTLVYAVVLGFFEDYTDILATWSYSVTFLAAFVLQILTHCTFWLKSVVFRHFRAKEGKKYMLAMIFGVWAIMFFSKFVFLAVIEFLFEDSVELTGFIGLVVIIASLTIIKRLIDGIESRLA